MTRKSLTQATRRILATACLTALSGLASAENHALIMTIDYAGTPNALPGIDKDARLARKIAEAVGVSPENITSVSNRRVTHGGIRNAIGGLADRIAPGDKVMLYFSGHGLQVDAPDSASRCAEGMVSADAKVYFDRALQNDLEKLAGKASQVIMFNDSCFAGGAASKSIGRADEIEGALPGVTTTKAKFFGGSISAPASNAPGYQCGQAVNKFGRNLIATGREKGANVLYVAAAADNEVASATNLGSVATLAWEQCILASQSDTNASGALDGAELKRCAQAFIKRHRFRQTITLVGDKELPVFLGSSAQQTPGQVIGAAALEDLRRTASKDYRVTLSPARKALRIGQDEFDFSVSTNRGGYLYILLVGSDGKSLYQLFPNDNDRNNFIQAGTHQFPRPEWKIGAHGPEGENYLMAVVSPVQRSFGKFKQGMFASASVDPSLSKNLHDEPRGGGRFGASSVVSVREVR